MPKIDYQELKSLSEELTKIKIDIVPHLKDYDTAYDAFAADKNLSGLAWDSGKNYHENYKVLSDSLFNALYDLDDTLKAHLASFESLVGTAENKLDTDEMQDLLTQLRSLQTQKLQFMEEMAKALKDVPVLREFFGQQTMFGTASEIELLKRYEQFEQTAVGTFDGVQVTIQAILDGLAYLGNGKNFENGSKGYNAASINELTWHKTLVSYNEANKEDRYEIVEVPIDNKGHTEPFIYKNGVMDEEASAKMNKVKDKQMMAFLKKEGPDLLKILIGLDDVEIVLDEDSTGVQKTTSGVFILMSVLPAEKVKDIIKVAKLLKDGDKSIGAIKLTAKEYKMLKEVEKSAEIGKVAKKEAAAVKIVKTIDDLKDTENFTEKSLKHIFKGEMNRKGFPTGYHYDGIDDAVVSIVEGTVSKPNKFGIYEAQVEIDGVLKQANAGKSSFFPDSWDSQKVIDAINEAYENKSLLRDNKFVGKLENGMDIEMYVDLKTGKINSAFPVY